MSATNRLVTPLHYRSRDFCSGRFIMESIRRSVPPTLHALLADFIKFVLSLVEYQKYPSFGQLRMVDGTWIMPLIICYYLSLRYRATREASAVGTYGNAATVITRNGNYGCLLYVCTYCYNILFWTGCEDGGAQVQGMVHVSSDLTWLYGK